MKPVLNFSAKSLIRIHSFSSNALIAGNPADIVSAFPEKVLACITGSGISGLNSFINSLFPPIAPTGNPPPIILPIQVKSGVISKKLCAPPWSILKEITSSKIKMMPCLVAESLRACRNSFVAGTIPIDPRTGSTIIAANSEAYLSIRACAILGWLYGQMTVSSKTLSGKLPSIGSELGSSRSPLFLGKGARDTSAIS